MRSPGFVPSSRSLAVTPLVGMWGPSLGHALHHHLSIGHRFFELSKLLLPDIFKQLIVKNISSVAYQLKGYESNGKRILMCIKFK